MRWRVIKGEEGDENEGAKERSSFELLCLFDSFGVVETQVLVVAETSKGCSLPRAKNFLAMNIALTLRSRCRNQQRCMYSMAINS